MEAKAFDPVKAGIAKVAARKRHIGLSGAEASMKTTGGLLKAMDALPLAWDAPVEVRVRMKGMYVSTELIGLAEEDGRLVILAETTESGYVRLKDVMGHGN